MSNCPQATIKYECDAPSFGYTDKTTEFDDELIRRGIITKEQAIIRKGATVSEAHRIVQEAKTVVTTTEKSASRCDPNSLLTEDHDFTTASDADSENEEDREVLLRYHQRRLEEYRKETESSRAVVKPPCFGEVIPISRSDWKREVNEVIPSGTWVIVNLTSDGNCVSAPHWNECKKVEDATHGLAHRFPHIKFVSINSTSAIENWPSEHLPAMFLYRDGEMRYQMVSLKDFGGPGVSERRLEWILATKFAVIQSNLEVEPEKAEFDECLREDAHYRYNGRGMVGSLMTSRRDESDQEDL
jgi:hypothetical protein